MKDVSRNNNDPRDRLTIVLSSVNRPINLLADNFSKQTKVDSHKTYKDVSQICYFERQEYLERTKRGKIFFIVLLGVFIVIVSSVISLFIRGVIQLDVNHINPTWWILITSELTICPSLAVLTWKIRYQIKADGSLLFANMTSFSLELRESEIKGNTDGFKEKYKSWVDSNQFSSNSTIEGNNKYLDAIQREPNIRLLFYKLSCLQSKVMSTLSENLSVEIVIFISTIIASIVTMVANMLSVAELTTITLIQDVSLLVLSCVVAIPLGFYMANRSFKKTINLAVIRYFLYSYLTDAK